MKEHPHLLGKTTLRILGAVVAFHVKKTPGLNSMTQSWDAGKGKYRITLKVVPK